MVTDSPKSGRFTSAMPMAAGSPAWTGAPCASGNRAVISAARIACMGVIGRIETTSGPAKIPAGLHATLVRNIGTVRLFLDVTQRQTGPQHGVFKTERTAEEKRHQIGSPPAADVGRLIDQHTVLEHAIAREIGSQIGPGSRAARLGRAGIEHLEDWARLRIALTEQQEVECDRLRDDHEVRLKIAGGLPAARTAQIAVRMAIRTSRGDCSAESRWSAIFTSSAANQTQYASNRRVQKAGGRSRPRPPVCEQWASQLLRLCD